MQVAPELALLALALHRAHHLAIHDERADVGAAGLLDELLRDDAGLQAIEGLHHRARGVLALREDHAEALRTLQQLQDQGRTAHGVYYLIDVPAEVAEYRLR